MAVSILVINGPNLNLLGERQPELYGSATLIDIEQNCIEAGRSLGLDVACKQSNHEGEIVTAIQDVRQTAAGILINAGAYTHTSVAILDALNAFDGLVVELHISQVFKREAFRHHSFISARADAVMAGFGVDGYQLALRYFADTLSTSHTSRS